MGRVPLGSGTNCERTCAYQGTHCLQVRFPIVTEESAVLGSSDMDTTTLLLIIIVVLLLGGGGFYGRGRWF